MRLPDKPHAPVSHAAAGMRVLVVEDDRPLALMVAEYLAAEGMSVSVVHRGDVAVSRMVTERPDAVILDVNLPDVSGFEVCRRARPRYDGPILMLTARGGELDEVEGLMSGADDYLAKPLRPQALLARLLSHWRRKPGRPPGSVPPLVVGRLVVDLDRREAIFEDRRLDLSAAEYDLLVILAQRAGSVVSRDELSEALLGVPYDPKDRSIDLRVSRLRRKLDDSQTNPALIMAARGVGYGLVRDPGQR